MDENELKKFPCYLINLLRRPERLRDTHKELDKCGWRQVCRQPTLFVAYDGWKLPLAKQYEANMGGVSGCKRSHEECLGKSIEEGSKGVIVLEDDLYMANPTNFVIQLKQFLNWVPDDWDMLMIGNQHYQKSAQLVNPHVWKLLGSQRMQFYVVRDRPHVDFRRELYRH